MLPRILFVEDHLDTRVMVTQWLGLHGYECTPAESVDEGLSKAKKEPFDLFLLDYKFTDGNGRELCEQIRKFDPSTPIIFFTASHPRLEEEVMACGAQGFVLKPEFERLSETIDRALCH
jgi:two-component system response regulator VicR